MFYWNGISSDSKGLVVSKEIRIPKPEKRFEKVEIEGRNGYLTIDKGTYEPILVAVECHIVNKNMTEIYKWLDGYGMFSIDNVTEYEAVVVNQIDLQKVTQFYDNVLIQFELQPVKHSKTENTVSVTGTPKMVMCDSTATVEPTLEIDIAGDIDITVNNKTFYLRDINGIAKLNSCLKTIVEAGQNISNKMYGDFPVFIPGKNTISYILGEDAVLTSFTIKYKKAYL